MQYYVVDAFSDKLFKGNPAGVCLLDDFPNDETMQNIAAENNLAETAFVVKRENYYDLRWFTPEIEVDLCGHATLASAFVLSNFTGEKAAPICFKTKSGTLTVTKKDDLYEMDFPARKPVPTEFTPQMAKAVNLPTLPAFLSRDLVLLLENEKQVREFTPNFELITPIPGH